MYNFGSCGCHPTRNKPQITRAGLWSPSDQHAKLQRYAGDLVGAAAWRGWTLRRTQAEYLPEPEDGE